jgi:ABC-type methionine transport system ATPase subunit
VPYFSVSQPRSAAPVIDLDDEAFRYPWPTGEGTVAIARLLLMAPAIVIMDEAAAHLGSSPRRHCSGP